MEQREEGKWGGRCGVGVCNMMLIEYQLELVFLRLLLKRPLLSESTLRITLLEAGGQSANPTPLQTEELRIKRTQKVVELESLNSFKFHGSSTCSDTHFSIRYEIKGNSVERVRSIPVNVSRMIADYEASGKSTFEETYAGENAELAFKFFLSPPDPASLHLLVTPERED